MYTITYDNLILHDPRVENLKTLVVNPKLTLEENKQGTLTFNILPTHPYYADVKKLKGEITVYQDGEWLWSGRMLNDSGDIDRIKNCSCEGELAYFLDSIQNAVQFNNSTADSFFRSLVTNHNSQVDPSKRFVVGMVTVSDGTANRFTNYEKTWSVITDKLIGKAGGFIRTRRENGQKIVDYIAENDHINTQVIEYGKNILNLKKTEKGENIATVIIPLGAKISSESSNSETAEPRTTIASVNNGKIYLEDADAIEQYGRIVDVVIFDELTDPAAIKAKGQAELVTRRLINNTIELTALDLHHLNINVEKIKVGDKIRVFSIPHELDIYLTVTKMEIDLANVANTVVTLGKTFQTLTGITSSVNQKEIIQQVIQSYGYDEKINSAATEITNVSVSLLTLGNRVNTETATKAEVQALTEAINNLNDKLSESDGTLNFNAPSVFFDGLKINDNGTMFDVLEIIRGLGGES